ncbi:MAG: ABC transporter ATP-binding protein [Verrucomicrobiota bacterium]
MKHIFRALEFFRADLKRILLAVLLLVLSTVSSLLKPWPLALIVDSVLGAKPLPSWFPEALSQMDRSILLPVLILFLFAIHSSQGLLNSWQNFMSIEVGLRGLARVRRELFSQLQRLSMRFHQGASQGDVIYRATWDTYAFQTLMQQGVFTLLTASLSLVLMLAVMWQLNSRLALMALGFVPVLVLTMKFFGKQMKDRSLAAHQADSRVASLFQQSIVAWPLIQSFTRQPDEETRFAEETQTALQKRKAQHGWEVIYWLVIALLFGLGTAGLIWLGVRQVLSGQLSLGELLIFVAYLAQWYEPLNQLSHVGTTVSDAAAGTHRVFELLDTPEEVRDVPNARPVAAAKTRGDVAPPGSTVAPLWVQGRLAFDQVSFGYNPHRLVLREVRFEIKPGESVAIIGPSGAGKTTLLQLLPRFYDPTAGAVRLDGADLRELRLADVRAQVALVFQEPLLLAATVAENIAYGKPEASPLEIEAAARAAFAHDFILQLPDQYQTRIGEGGVRLSVGEKQRLNLARAFLKNAPILALDEPTSALDSESEQAVVTSLNALMRDRTTLVVAHRFSTIKKVDRLVVLESGRITEMGSMEELLGRNGYVARLAAART